ncbi:MAG: pilus assembly protein [Alphaproteobacteria bacterium]|nr:pilus assembly protein [Alphaproteobacteria bacterium]
MANREGVAAVEFAMIAPVLIAMFFGTIELSSMLQCASDVKLMAGTAADLTAQASQIANSDESNIFAAVNTILYPYPTTGCRITLTSIVDDGHGGGKVAWSDSSSGAGYAVNTPMTVPAGVLPAGGSVILAEVSYPYQSPTTVQVAGTITLTRSAYSTPRTVTQIPRV